jgi:hypothetical protein
MILCQILIFIIETQNCFHGRLAGKRSLNGKTLKKPMAFPFSTTKKKAARHPCEKWVV